MPAVAVQLGPKRFVEIEEAVPRCLGVVAKRVGHLRIAVVHARGTEERGRRIATERASTRKSGDVLVQARTKLIVSADELNADSTALSDVDHVRQHRMASPYSRSRKLEIDDAPQRGRRIDLHECTAPADVGDVSISR